MKLSKYISDLLHRYNTVVVPDFGTFLLNVISYNDSEVLGNYNPPTKKISFSKNRKNDNLLVNYISKVEGVSKNEARIIIKNTVLQWKSTLVDGDAISLGNIGVMTMKNNEIVLAEISKGNSFLNISYGLSTILTTPIAISENKKTNYKSILKYAVAIFLPIAAILYIYNFGTDIKGFNVNKASFGFMEKTAVVNSTKVENINKKLNSKENKVLKLKMDLSSSGLVNLSSLSKNIITIKQYRVVAGAFYEHANALKQLRQLKAEGYQDAVLEPRKRNRTMVLFGSFDSRKQAKKMYYSLKKKGVDAWIKRVR